MNLQNNKLEVHDESIGLLITWVIIMLFLPFYGFVFFSNLPNFIGDNVIMRMLAFPIQLLLTIIMRLFFSSITTHFIVIVSLMLLVVILLKNRAHSRVSLFKWIFLLFYILALPLLFQYKAALFPAPGIEMKLVTQPILWEKLTRTAQIIAEQQPCEYEVLGWQDNWLYFQSNCNGTIRFWRFDSNQNVKPQVVDVIPRDIVSITLPHNEVLTMVQVKDFRPRKDEESIRAILLVGDGLINPDSDWIAIISQHIYGPQDIVLVRAASR